MPWHIRSKRFVPIHEVKRRLSRDNGVPQICRGLPDELGAEHDRFVAKRSRSVTPQRITQEGLPVRLGSILFKNAEGGQKLQQTP